ncbi:TPA: hypothetical protein ACPVZG_004092 [Vibrio parahaemolyticus]
MQTPITIKKTTFREGQKLTPVIVFYPQSNARKAALLDEHNNLVGFETDRLYHPAGGIAGCQQIADSGLVVGSEYYGYECRHAHDNVYVLGSD